MDIIGWSEDKRKEICKYYRYNFCYNKNTLRVKCEKNPHPCKFFEPKEEKDNCGNNRM